MKIAIVTDDSRTISERFGRARGALVLTVERGTVHAREMRELSAAPGSSIAALIGDCDAVLARDIDAATQATLQRNGVRPVIAQVAELDAALAAFLASTPAD